MKCTFHAPQATRPLCWGIACCTVWFYFPFGVLLPYLCSDLVYSVYFNDDTTQVLEQVRQAMDANDARNEASLRYVKTLSLRNTSVDTSGAFDVTVAIVTRNRGWSGITKNLQLGYLTQTFASLHRAAANSRLRVKLFVCNVDAQPDTFREASALHEHVHTFTKYSSKTAHIPEDLYEKQKQDYSDCLKHSAATWRSQYVVMFEDDVIVRHSFLRELSALLRTELVLQQERRRLEPRDLAFIKLTYPSQWRGFSLSSNAFELVGIVLLSASLCHVVFTLCFMRLLPRWCTQHNSTSVIHSSTAVGALWCTMLCYVIGRPYIAQVFTLHPGLFRLQFGAPGCCILSVLYPSAIVPRLVDYLQSTTCHIDFAVDSAIDVFATQHSLYSFRSEPNLGTHIGMLSGLRRSAKVAAHFLDRNLL